MRSTKLRNWELSLLFALCAALGAGIWGAQTRNDLSGKLIRLHVIANSDSEADQAEKLQVRDRILDELSPLLADCKTQAEAAAVIEAQRTKLEAPGDISVQLTTEYYPARDYATFSLPAGEYLSLQVTVGAGQGHNWWCVVFPPLCTEALAEPDQDTFQLLSEDETGLITRSDPGYVLRFHLVDWLGQLQKE